VVTRAMRTRKVAILGYEGAMALDIVGPFDAFCTATFENCGETSKCYEVSVIGLSQRPFTTESGIVLQPRKTIADFQNCDTLIIPGGVGLRHPKVQSRVSAWIAQIAPRVRRIAMVCTGVYGVAPTGMLDGLTVTTHWRHAEDLARKYPSLSVSADSLYCKQGKLYTCAGVTAGIDLTLALIEEDHGSAVALAVARELVVYLKRPGGQEQYSELLRFQTAARNRFSDLVGWIRTNLQENLTIDILADRVHLSPRQFNRAFREAFQTSPAAFVQELRLDEARVRLTASEESVGRIATSVGFENVDVFSRAFKRRFDVPPRDYRARFQSRLKT
jgi:transcriptional regulator GlxA family with amidase domain